MPTLTAPHSPGVRARSVSQPLREGIETNFFQYAATSDSSSRNGYGRSSSSHSNSGYGSYGRSSGSSAQGGLAPSSPRRSGRTRSGSLVTVTEVGGDEPDNINDRLGVGANHNAAWVNAPGAWVIHPVLVLGAKLLIDAVPGIENSLSWTIVNVGYMIVSVDVGRSQRSCCTGRDGFPRSNKAGAAEKDNQASSSPVGHMAAQHVLLAACCGRGRDIDATGPGPFT